MAAPPSPPKKSSSNNGRPPQAVRFARRTSSGRVVNLSRDDDIDMSGEYSGGSGDFINYTVMMPPTPDNQPGSEGGGGGGGGSSSTSRFRTQSGDRGGNQDNAAGGLAGKLDRRVSVMKSNSKSMLMRSQTQDFDHNRWLFETKGKYGIGNAFWSEEEAYDPSDVSMSMDDFMDKPWKPLTRKINVPAAVISPYRYLYLLHSKTCSLR